MLQTEQEIEVLLSELKQYFATIIVMIEQGLAVDAEVRPGALVDINEQVQSIMVAVGPKTRELHQTVLGINNKRVKISTRLADEINEFLEKMSPALQMLLDQLNISLDSWQDKRDDIKDRLLQIQQNHRGLGGYKHSTRFQSKMLDSTA